MSTPATEPRTANATAASAAARRRRREIEQTVRRGEVGLVDLLLLDEHAEIRHAAGRLRIERLLQFAPGVGETTVRIICARADVIPTVRLSALSPRRRAGLAVHLQRFDLTAYRGAGPVREIR